MPLEPDQYRARLVLFRRPDVRRLREAGSRGDGRAHPRLRAGRRHARAQISAVGRQPFRDFTMSGTSQAAAVTSGVVALMLEVNPLLTPDQVKCRLMDSARPAVKPDGHARVLRVPAGRRPRERAGCGRTARRRLRQRRSQRVLDLSGVKHFGGRANQDADGNFYIMAVQGACAQDFAPRRSAGRLGGVVGGLGDR